MTEQDRKICKDCGQPLEPVIFYVHHTMKHELDWLVQHRMATSEEESIDDVLTRLIRLEVDKRKRIEERKQENSKR